MKNILITIGILSMLVLLAGQGCEQKTACPEDAKICPDGTAVARTGPDCEFQECPALPDDCGALDAEFRDACCAEQNKDKIHILCVGSWKYEQTGCKFVCETDIIS